MARTWLQVRVDLVAGFGERFSPTAGRIFIVGPSHTFAGLRESINQAFAHWDLAHLHEFQLADGRRSGFADPDGFIDDEEVEDHEQIKVTAAVTPGEEFGLHV